MFCLYCVLLISVQYVRIKNKTTTNNSNAILQPPDLLKLKPGVCHIYWPGQLPGLLCRHVILLIDLTALWSWLLSSSGHHITLLSMLDIVVRVFRVCECTKAASVIA